MSALYIRYRTYPSLVITGWSWADEAPPPSFTKILVKTCERAGYCVFSLSTCCTVRRGKLPGSHEIISR